MIHNNSSSRARRRIPIMWTASSVCLLLAAMMPFSEAFSTSSSRIRAIRGATAAIIPKSRPSSVALLRATDNNNNDQERSSTKNNLLKKQLERSLKDCQSGSAAKRILETTLLKNDNNEQPAALYQSITIPPDSSAKGLSDGDLAIRTRIRNTKFGIMDVIDINGNRDADRTSLAILAVFVASSGSALVANQNFPGPEILRFLVVWLFSFAPLAFVGVGIATPDGLQAVLVNVQRLLFPAYRTRMVQHEAGHFLLGHLLGFPIQDYQANAVKNAVTLYPLNDPNAGTDRARLLGFDKPAREQVEEPPAIQERVVAFFDEDGRGGDIVEEQSVFGKEAANKRNYTKFATLEKEMEPRASWPYRGLDDATLDKLAVISVAGVCAEILAYGNAEGGLADFSQLKQLLLAAGADRDEPMTDREVDNRIRFALGYTMSQLRGHLAALDALADVMKRDGSIAECVVAIESYASNPSGNDGISVQDYESVRKEQFQQSNAILRVLEPFLLGEVKSADVQENRMVQGKGGGYKKESAHLLTGDDPFYLALALSVGFFFWASLGGLYLH